MDPVTDLGQVQVSSPDHLHLIGVYQLVVEDVPGQQHLPLAPGELAQVHPGGPQRDRAPVQPVDGRGVQERPPPADPQHDAGHHRVRLPAVHLRDQVADLTYLIPGLIEHRAADEPGQRHDVLPELAGGQGLRRGLDEALGDHGPGAARLRGVPAAAKEPVGHSNLLCSAGCPVSRASAQGWDGQPETDG